MIFLAILIDAALSLTSIYTRLVELNQVSNFPDSVDSHP